MNRDIHKIVDLDSGLKKSILCCKEHEYSLVFINEKDLIKEDFK